MLTVTNYVSRTNQEGKSYCALKLTSDDPETVLSRATGRYYITARKCYMSTTFNEAICRNLLGKQFPDSIVRTECEPYEFTVPETGEVITSPVESGTTEQAVFGKQMETT